jgi:hypothetical protein
MYISYSFLTSVLDGGEWSAALRRGEDPRYPLYRRLGEPHRRSAHRGRNKANSHSLIELFLALTEPRVQHHRNKDPETMALTALPHIILL